MTEKIVVIGSNCFSGSHFVNYCLAQGLDVLGISRSIPPALPFLPYLWNGTSAANFKFEQLDLNHHTDQIAATIHSYHPDYVVNFAAQGMVAESWIHPEHWYQTNVVANVKLHDQLRHFSFLKKYVHVSTPEVYGTCQGNVLETTAFNPSTPYAASRAACEMHLNTFFKNYRFPVVFTRAANVYGPGQQLYRIIPRTILSILLGKKIPLHGGGHSVRAFIPISDVASGTLKVARLGIPGEGYHFSTDRFISIRDLVTMICHRMGASFDTTVTIVDDRPGKDAAYLLDSTKSKKELDWRPSIELEQGLDEVIAWAKRWLSELENQPSEYIHKA
ncbi:MAG TPA: GDP-mannose 4,6-dehydratase [Chthoniobacterales bacterium]|nr:GDP-mannose 4,6-dehydratase [Chthoniobacterales bacterium]